MWWLWVDSKKYFKYRICKEFLDLYFCSYRQSYRQQGMLSPSSSLKKHSAKPPDKPRLSFINCLAAYAGFAVYTASDRTSLYSVDDKAYEIGMGNQSVASTS